tara:strand:- start:252 stop:830 length:579 start_codon:yes stop_codon:yes gene_type:complete
MDFSNKLLAKLAIGVTLVSSPLLAGENSGWYATGSIGASQINDLDYVNSTNKITFDSGLGFDLGAGYDFGSTRIEGSWNRGQSSGGVDSGVAFTTDSIIDSLLVSAFYDFRSSKQWSPFVGLSLGATRIEHASERDTGFSYGLALGVSYKTSDNTEVFVKSSGIITPELETSSWKITNGSYGNGTIGFRYIF